MGTESILPAETGRELMNRLIAADIIGGKVKRVIIDAQADDVMRVYVEHFGDERTRTIVCDVLAKDGAFGGACKNCGDLMADPEARLSGYCLECYVSAAGSDPNKGE